MLGGLGNLSGLMKSAKVLKEQMATLQAELAHKRYDADAGGGLVRVVVDGRCTLVDVKIDPEAAKDVELLGDLVKAAVGAAVAKAQDAMKADMAALTGGLNLPGINEMLGGPST